MAISRIARLRHPGVLRDFTWPANLPTFRRYNLIYGWNGTGKTIISRLFRALEHRTPPASGEVTFTINGSDISGNDFVQSTLAVRVFNRDFVTETVFPVGGGDVPPIFVVGKERVEKQKEVERLKAERTTQEANLASARSKKQAAEKAFDRFCIDQARVIKETLRSPGRNPYNNYDKSDFEDDAKKMVADGNAATHRLTEPKRDRLIAQQQAKPKPKVQDVAYQLPALQELSDRVSALLRTTVVSAAIQALKEDPELAEWTRDGLRLHKGRQAEKCLFCEQPLPDGRLAALEAHFSTEYERVIRKLDEQISGLEATSKEAAALELPNRAELYDDLAPEYDTAEQAVRGAVKSVRQFVDALADKLSEKKAKPFDHLSLDVAMPVVDADVVGRLNEVIRKHNQRCDDFESRVSEARDRLALDMIAEAIVQFAKLQEDLQEAARDVNETEKEVRELKERIRQLEREIVEHRRPAEELNEDLVRYLGHGELKLRVEETGYTITRNGEPAQKLSEGEMTAIALLYFLKSLEDREFDLQNGVVVLDDPVSSLDQNSLFGAFGYIRARTQDAAQVIILTHNFLFFQMVREWFRNLRGQDKRAWQVFMLEFTFDDMARSSKIQVIDPLLMDFDSEYHYLFARLYRMATGPRARSLEQYYWAPSIARRVVETFLAFRVPNLGGHNRLWGQMRTVEFDEEKKSRIYRYVQMHSHRDAVGNPDPDLTLLGESRAVLNDTLDFMRAADLDHVSRMIERVTNGGEKGTT